MYILKSIWLSFFFCRTYKKIFWKMLKAGWIHCCFGPPWLSLYGQKYSSIPQKKKSSSFCMASGRVHYVRMFIFWESDPFNTLASNGRLLRKKNNSYWFSYVSCLQNGIAHLLLSDTCEVCINSMLLDSCHPCALERWARMHVTHHMKMVSEVYTFTHTHNHYLLLTRKSGLSVIGLCYYYTAVRHH